MSDGSSRIFNVITIIFLILSVLACIWVVLTLAGPPPADPNAGAIVVPTIALLPTLIPSATATATDLPTFTPTATQTLVPSITPMPSATLAPPTATFTPSPSATITVTPGPTTTPSPTATPTETLPPPPTATATLEPSPTGPTLSPFPFDVRGSAPTFTANFANTAGCAWQGLGGQVFDVNGQPLNNIRIHVFGNNFEQFTASGSNTLYGAGGWEITVGSGISASTFVVELLSSQGTTISPQVTVGFPSDCNGNLAVVNFIQTRPF